MRDTIWLTCAVCLHGVLMRQLLLLLSSFSCNPWTVLSSKMVACLVPASIIPDCFLWKVVDGLFYIPLITLLLALLFVIIRFLVSLFVLFVILLYCIGSNCNVSCNGESIYKVALLFNRTCSKSTPQISAAIGACTCSVQKLCMTANIPSRSLVVFSHYMSYSFTYSTQSP